MSTLFLYNPHSKKIEPLVTSISEELEHKESAQRDSTSLNNPSLEEWRRIINEDLLDRALRLRGLSLLQAKFATSSVEIRQNFVTGKILDFSIEDKSIEPNTSLVTTQSQVLQKGFDPMGFRHLCLSVRYREDLSFSWSDLTASQTDWNKLQHLCSTLSSRATELKSPQGKKWNDKFVAAICDDLNLPKSLAILRMLLKSDLPHGEKGALILEFDKVLGLKLSSINAKETKNHEVELLDLIQKRRKPSIAKEETK